MYIKNKLSANLRIFCGDLWRNSRPVCWSQILMLMLNFLKTSVDTLPPADLLQSALMHSSAICPHQTTQLVSHQPTKENLFFLKKKSFQKKFTEHLVFRSIIISHLVFLTYRVCQLDMLHFEVPDGQYKLT